MTTFLPIINNMPCCQCRNKLRELSTCLMRDNGQESIDEAAKLNEFRFTSLKESVSKECASYAYERET